MNRIITISREFGSGGHTIGKLVAEKLGIPCYDSELIDRIQAESGYAKEYIEENGEYANSTSWLNQVFAARDFGGRSIQDDLFIIQSRVIREIAEKESCVIVGRCADYILHDRADCLRVFIHADVETRANYILKHYGERSDSVEKRLKDKDRRRSTYYHYYTDMNWGDAENYDVTLNSGRLGISKCVDILASLY